MNSANLSLEMFSKKDSKNNSLLFSEIVNLVFLKIIFLLSFYAIGVALNL